MSFARRSGVGIVSPSPRLPCQTRLRINPARFRPADAAPLFESRPGRWEETMANRTIHRPARPLSKKHQAALKHQRNGARRRLWLIALKIWPAVLVVAMGGVLIYA